MRILALSAFDPASVVLSHRDLMRAAGHDFRLAVVRAYTERQQRADYVCERLVRRVEDVAPGVSRVQMAWEKLNPNLESLREFAVSADVIQFHPGIGRGDGDWASSPGSYQLPLHEEAEVLERLRIPARSALREGVEEVAFFHGSVNAWYNRDHYKAWSKLGKDWGHGEPILAGVAASTIDYAHELDAAYLPPLVDVGDLRAKLRGDDDPLLIAHTPTDRVACSTEEFLKAAQGLGIPVRFGEGMRHDDVLRLKAECNVGFDHLRGAFSTNTLENAALGLVPLFKLSEKYRGRFNAECRDIHVEGLAYNRIAQSGGLRDAIRVLDADPYWMRGQQRNARFWWETYFSAEPITKRLTKFYESL